MEKIVKSSNTQKHILLLDDVVFASTKQQKWWKSNLVLCKGDEEFAVLQKDSFWKWNFSLMKGAERLFTIRSKWNGDILIETEKGEVWKVKKKGGSDNRIALVKTDGQEVLVMEKQGKWWQARPYKVMSEEIESWPLLDDVLPLVIIAALGLLQQRFMWIFIAVMFAQMAVNRS